MISKIKKYLEEHESIKQFVMFLLISCVAAVVEISSYLIINNIVLKSLNSDPFHWWIFNYDGGTTGGLGTMVAFLISTFLAQVISFIANRKKTFKANNNVVFSAIMYATMVIIIVGLQTYSGPIIVNKLNDLLNNPDLSILFGKWLCMFLAFFIIYPMSKYVIMRNNDKDEPHETKNQNTNIS